MTRSSATTRRSALLARSALGGVVGAMALGALPALAQVTQVGTITGTNVNSGGLPAIDNSAPGQVGVTLGGSRSIINWSDLNVEAGETLNFDFANRGWIVVNRVTGGVATLNGTLNANCSALCSGGAGTGGNVWMLSAGGVMIGGAAQINTGGFLASTGNLTDGDILDGDMNFAFTGAAAGSAVNVANGAQITTSGGTLALIAPVVTTAAGATLTATNGGDVVYGAAENYNVTFAPTGTDDLDLISFQVPSQTDGAGGAPGLTLNGTTNGNQVFAAVVSKASVASSILLGGSITATAASGENGDIVLSAGGSFTNGVADTPLGFDASITQNTTSTLTADNVTLRASDNIAVDKINATGRVWLNSEWTSISQTGAITANVLRAEAGGDVILTNAGNDFNFLTYIEAQGVNGIDIVDADGFVINDYVFHFGGGTRTASLTALTGSISSTGSGVIQVGMLNVSAVGGSIDLGSAASNTTNLGTITAGAGDFAYRSLLDVNVAGVITASNVGLSSLAGQITESGGGAILASSLTASASNGISLSNANNDISAIAGLSNSGSGDVVYGQTDGFQITGAVTAVGQGMSLSSTNGSITQTASGIITAGLLNANAGADLILDQANIVGGIGNLMAGGGAGDDLVFNSTLGFAVSGTVGGDDITLTSGGSISQGAASRIVANFLTVDAAGGIDLPNGGFGTGNDIDALGLVTAGGAVSIASISALVLTADIDTSGADLSLYSQLGITQSGGVLKVGALYAQSRADGITLNQANEVASLGHIFVESSGDFTFRNVGDVVVNGMVEVIGDNISLTSDTGSVVVNGVGMRAAALSVSAQTGINLNRSNSIGTITALTTAAGDITFLNSGGFNIAGAVSADNVTLTSTAGAITQSSGIITADVLTASAAGGIDLDQVNAVTTLGALTAGATGDVTFTNSGDLELTGNIASGAGGVAAITSTTGAIDQISGAITADWIKLDAATTITQGSGATLSSTALSLTSGGNVSLAQANSFTSLYDLAVGGDLTLRNAGNIDMGPTLSGLYSAGGALSLTSDTGSIFTTGAGVITSRLTASAAGSITLDGAIASLGAVTAGGNILLNTYSTAMDLTGDVTGQTVSLYADSGVAQSGGKIDASRLNVITSGAISLTGANEIDVVGRLNTDQFLGGTGANVTLRNVGAIVLDYLVEAAGATASFTSDTGAITQTGFGAITANRLIASAAGAITLYDGTNNVATIGGLATVGGDIVYRDVDGFDIQGDITANAAITRGVMLVAGGTGAITQTSGVFDVGYFRGISGGSITLGGANQIRRLISTVISNGALSLNTTTGLSVDGTVSANAVSLTSAAAITQATNAQIWTNTLNVSAVTGVNLAASGFGANNIGNLGTIANTTSGGITIANAYPSMNLTGNITAAGQAVSISNTMAGINQTGGIITAGALSLSAAGAISATRNNAVDSLGVVTAAGDVAITNIGQLMVTGSVNTGGGDLSLVSTTGQIEQTGGIVTADVLNLAAGGRIWVNNANAVNSLGVVTAGGHILFRNQANTIVGGDITATGFDVTLRSNTGSVTQTAGSDISSQYLQVIAQSGVNLTNAGNNVAELAWVDNATGGVAFGQTNGFTVSYLRAGGQAVSLTSLAGAITQNAGWSLTAGTLNASAAGTLTLNQSTNVDNLGVISTGGSFLFRDLNGFNLTGNVTAASQVVMVAQNGSINQTGGVITAADINAMATGDILLGSANIVGAISALSAGNDLLYRQVGDLAVPTISATGTVSLYSTTGDITQTGRITTDTLVLGAFDDITLGQNFISKLGQIDAGGDFDASNAAGLSSGALGLTGNITVGGAMTLVNPGAIFQTSSTGITAGSLFIDTDGALGATGDNSISGNTRLSATGAVFNAVGDLTLQVNVTGFATITGAGAVVFDGVGASTGDTLNVEAVNGISQGAAGLNFTKFGNLTNTTTGGISLTNDSWMTLNGAISALGQTVTLNVVSGGIIQSSGSNIAANRLSVTSTQGALMGEMNQVDELGVINVGAHNFLFRTLGDLLIDGDLSSALNVNLTSATGSIGQTAGSDITAGTLNVTADTGINLTNAGNDVGTLRTMINLGGSGGIAYAQTDGFQIDSVIRAWNQMVSLSSLAGGISETGTTFAQIEAGTLNVSAAGAITLHRDNDIDNLGVVSAVGGFTFNDVDGFNLTGNVSGGGAVVLDARNGSILQTGGVISASSIDAAASGNLALGSANVVGAVTALTAGGDILYRQVGNLSVPAITATGSLSLYSTTGSISQTGALNAATLNLGAVTGILLGNAGNDIGALGTVSNATSGQINFLNGDDFDLTGAITAGGSQFVSLNALSGAITQQASGSITAQVLSLVAWSGATLGGDNDVDALGVILGGPSFVFNDIDDVDISGALNAQAADLTAGGAITQSAGNLDVGMLSLTAASVALDGANTITTLGDVDVTGNMSLSDVDGITLDGVQAVDGTLALTAGTFVTQQGGGLDVGRLEIDAGTAVSINLSGNAIGALGDVASTSGSIAIVNNNAGVALDIDGEVSAAGSGQTVYINSLGSGVTMTAAGSIISGANTDVRGGGNIVLGDIDAGGVLTVVAAGGSVTSTAAPTIAATRLTGTATTGSFILTGANIDIDEIGYIEVGNAFSITGNTGPLLLSNNIIAQTVSLGTTGALTQIGGSLDATTGSFSAGGALTLGANNSVDTVSLNGASVSYTSAGSFAANVVTATGAVSLTSTAGKITQTALTGKIVADSLAASAATGLEFFGGQNDIRVLAGLSSTGGGVTWRDRGGFEITGNISAAGQMVELVSDGTGADGTDVTQSGGVITANRLQGTSAGDLLFASANLVGQLGYLDAGGNIRFRGAASFTLQDNVNAGGGFILNADTGSIQQVGGVIVADAFAGTAGTGIGLSRANDVDFLGAVDAGTGDFNFRDLDSLAIAGLIAADNGVLLESGGNITQSSGSIVTGTLRLSVSGAAVVNGSGNDIDFLGESTGMNALAFADVDGFAISDRVFSSGAISLTAATGDIAEVAGGYLSANGLSVYASNGEIDLAGDNAIENIGDLIAGGDLTFHETDGFLTFGNIAGDALRLTADSGAIAQVSGAIFGDSLYASALTGLNLNAIGNDVDVITGLVNLTSGGISYHDADSVSITGAVTAIGQTVNFDVNGALTQTVTGVISAGRVQGAAMGAFALADAANEIAQLGPISADSISLVTVDTGLTIVGALYATQGVDLKADDSITQTAAGTITGQTLRAQADGDITLAGANDVDSITLLYSDFGDITYADVDGFSLDGSSLGDLWTGGAFTLAAGGNGSITQSGAALRAGTLLVSAGGDVTLDEANRIDVLGDSSAGGSVFQVVNLGDLEIAGDIAVAHATGAVDLTSQTGKVEQTSGEIDAYRVGGAAAGDFILTRFTNALGDITTTAGDIDITNAGDIFLFGTLETDNTDSVTLTSTAGSIGHGIGRIETGTLNLDAAIGIALDGAQANDVERLGTVRTYSNFAFRDDDGVDLTGDIDVTMVGASVNLTSSTGAITQSGGVITAYGLNLRTATGADLASANMVSQLNLTNSGAGDVYVINGKTISVGTAINLGGLVEIGTTAGDIVVATGIEARTIRLISAADIDAAHLEATGDILVDATNGDAEVGVLVVGDDATVQAVNGSARVLRATLFPVSDNEGDGNNLTIAAGTGDAILGADDEASIGAGNRLDRVSGVGGVFVSSLSGDAGVFLSSLNEKIDTLSANSATGAASLVFTGGAVSVGNVSGHDVLLKATTGGLFADSVTVGGGDYTLYGQLFSTAARKINGAARDISITDTQGGLELIDSIIAQRNLTLNVTGALVDGAGDVVLGAGGNPATGGNLTITAGGVQMFGLSANGDVAIDVGVTGSVNVTGTVLVKDDYTLTGGSFSTRALTPQGFTAGTWTINAGGAFDFSAVPELAYNGAVVVDANGDITGGDVESAAGSVTITGERIQLGSVWADGEIAVTADSGHDLGLYLAESFNGGVTLNGDNVTVSGGLFAAGDVLVEATDGAADVLAATAGGDITVSAVNGDAILGAAELGAGGDLTVSATNGDVIFGVLDGSTVSSANTFTRRPGLARGFGILAVGTTTFVSDTGDVTLNLYSTGHIDLIEAALDAEIYVETGDVSIGALHSIGGEAYAEAAGGALTIDHALADSGFLALYSTGGALTVISEAYGASGIEFQTDALLDLSTATVDTAADMDLVGGDVLAGQLTAGGYISVGALTGDAHVAFADAGDTVQVIAIDGSATLRGARGPNGVAVVAADTATFGADDKASITAANYAVAGIGGGCGCADGITVMSYFGDAVVNLQTITGVFDVIGAAEDGDVRVVLNTGNLTIGDLAGYNIDVAVETGTLETGYGDPGVFGVFLSGGDYSIKAQAFLGNVLTPELTNGTVKDVTVIDTAGGLDLTGISVVAQGDILIDVRGVGSALTGDAALTAGDGAGAGNVTVKAAAIALDRVEAEGDVDLDASAGVVDVATSVTVGGDYTLTGRNFSTAALRPLGAKAGDLSITDTLGTFDYSAGDLSYGGDIDIDSVGLVVGGAITSANGDIMIEADDGIDSTALSAVNGAIDAYGHGAAGVTVGSATADDRIYISSTGGDARLGAAALGGAGSNALSIIASRDATFGSLSGGGITAANTYSSSGSTTTASVRAGAGSASVFLDSADAISDVSAGGGHVEVYVRNGDLELGSVSATTDVNVEGSGGQLTIGALAAGTDAFLTGSGVALTDATIGDDLTVVANGDITFGGPAGSLVGTIKVTDTVSLTTVHTISQAIGARIVAGSLRLDAEEGASLLGANQIAQLRDITTDTGGFAYRSARTGGVSIVGTIDAAGQTVDLRTANGALTQSGAGRILAQRLIGSSDTGVTLAGANQIAELGAFTNTGGAFALNVDRALSVVGLVDSAGAIRIQSEGMTLAASGTVRSSATGAALVLASDGAFANLSGADGVQAANGRWLIYTQAPGAPTTPVTGNSFGGLSGKSFYGSTYNFGAGAFSTTPNAGNRFVYAYRPTLTVAPNSQVVTYNRQIPTLTALISGLRNGDLAADAWSGAPTLFGATSRNAGTYTLTAALGSLASDMNYDFAFGAGTLTINPKALTGTVNANDRTYNGTSIATGSIGLSGVIAGDTVTAGATAYSFANKNAGADKIVTAHDVTLGGVDRNNYVLSPVSTGLADISRLAIQATVNADNKTYDRSTDATGTITLAGVILGDDIGITGKLSFGDKNAGLNKLVTASNVVISGADAGNYAVATTTDVATIARRSVLGVITANSKTYDGTTAATGTVVLGGGVIAGDDFSMTADLAFLDRNAGFGKTVTVANVVARGADAGNYEVVSSVATADIFRKSITGAFTANDKTYDGAITATGTISLTGLITGDRVSAGGVYAFANKNAGVGKLVTASGVTLAGLDSGNYTLASVNGSDTADIFRKAITGLIVADNRIYDGTTNATGAITLTGVILGDNLSISGDLDFGDKNAGVSKTVTASNVLVTGADAGNYTVTTSTDQADILKRSISGVFTANDKTYDGTATATGAISLTGVIAGDSVAAGGAYAFADKRAGLNKTVTASGVALSGADAGNYQLDPLATAVADVLRKSLTGVLAASDKTYDGTTTANAAISLTGVVAGDEVSAGGSYAFANKNAGVGKTVTATGVALSGADAANYDLSPLATAVADILRRSITASINASDKTYDGTTTAAGSLTLTGVIAGDDLAVSGDLDFADRNAGLNKAVTASNLLLSGADAGNYDVTASTAIADILRKSLSGVLTANSKTYDGTTAATGAISLTGVIAGDSVAADGTYRFADKSAGVGKTVTATGVTLSGADAGNYQLDPLATAIADILRKSLGGVLAANDKTYDGTTNADGAISLTGVIAGDDVSAGGSYVFANKNAGVGKTVTATGVTLTGADAGNYDLGSLAAAVADILRREITGTVTAANKTYDGATDASGLITLTGVLDGDDLTVTGDLDFADRNAGTGKAVTASNLLFSGADAGNYTVTTTTAFADILRKAITGTFTANDKTYDGDTAATGAIVLSGLIAGDTVTAGGTYRFADRNAGVDKTVTVSGVSLSGADAGNYDLVTLPASALADILRRSVTVAADDLYKIVGTVEPTLTYRITLGDLVAGDSFTGALARATGETIGDYQIGQGTLALSDNYSLTFVPGVFTINPMPFAGQDSSDVLKYLRKPRGFDLNWDPSEFLNDGDGQDCIDPVTCATLTELDPAPATGVSMASLGWRRFLVAARSRLGGMSAE